MSTRIQRLLVCVVACVAGVPSADAQPLGTFRWQLQPFCNVIAVNVTQNGAVYTLDGYDDQCGAAQRAPLVGIATPNPDGTIGFGLHVVTVPGGAPVSIDARISFATLSGTWSDSAGNSGAFAFGSATGGGPRPTPTPAGGGDITGVTGGLGLTGGGTSGEVSLAVDPTVVQQRVSAVCRTGEAIRTVNADGTVVCERINAGDITGVTAGPGLTGGGTAGTVTISAVFAGDGALDAAARVDHEHTATGTLSTGLGISALGLNTGARNTAVGVDAMASNTTGSNNVALGHRALHDSVSTSENVAIGRLALDALQSGAGNTAVGNQALGLAAAAGHTVAIGDKALLSTTFSPLNTAVGARAGEALTQGGQNTFVGAYAALNLTTGDNNVIVGTGAGSGATTGTALTLLGLSADAAPGLTNATAIGAGAVVSQTNSLVLGNNASVGIGTSAPQDRLHVVGTIRVGTGTVGCVVDNDATVIAGTCPSDARFKRDVTPMEGILDRVERLQPVHYFWRDQEFPDRHFGSRISYGLIAQDVEQVLPELVTTAADGFKAVNYSKLPLLAIQAIRELKAANDELRRRLDALEAVSSSTASRRTRMATRP